MCVREKERESMCMSGLGIDQTPTPQKKSTTIKVAKTTLTLKHMITVYRLFKLGMLHTT